MHSDDSDVCGVTLVRSYFESISDDTDSESQSNSMNACIHMEQVGVQFVPFHKAIGWHKLFKTGNCITKYT